MRRGGARTCGILLAANLIAIAAQAKAEPFPAEFDLLSLLAANGGDGSQGFEINGVQPGDGAGIVGAVGDVNGDGLADMLVGATGVDTNGDAAGAAYLVLGRASGFPPRQFEWSHPAI